MTLAKPKVRVQPLSKSGQACKAGTMFLGSWMCDVCVGRAEGAAETKKNHHGLITRPICSPPAPV